MKTSELERYADKIATDVFTPLYLNHFFWLKNLALSGNMVAYDAYMEELMDKWTVPEEGVQPIVSDSDEEVFDLMCVEENDAN